MTKTRWVWLVSGFLYLAFFGWYTSFGGKLSEAEIDHYMGIMEKRVQDPNELTGLRRFLQEDTGDDFAMLNVIHMYDTPLPVDGVMPGDTSEDVLGKYMQYMWPALLARACHPVMTGSAANQSMELLNTPGMETWSSGALMRYRSRRDLMDITTNPAFSGSHDFKIAAMKKTFAFPVDPWFHLGDPRLLLGLFLFGLASVLSWIFARK